MSSNLEDSYFVNDDELIGGDSDADGSESSDSDSGSESGSDNGGVVAVDDDADDDNDTDDVGGSDDDDDDDDDDVEGVQSGGIGDHQDEVDDLNEGDEQPVEEERVTKSGKKIKKIPAKKIVKKAFADELSDEEDEDEDGEMYLKKFDREINENYIVNNHPECALQNYDEILAMTTVVRDSNNIIIDDLHRTNPFLTKYERARILGQRAKQIETGASPFVKVPEDIIDSYLIAEMELQQGRIPFIIRRPMPNGGSEYWKISDLENIAF
jgi:DNA-directed RNA polymerases I, II, and III subunit RPABC2